LQEDVALAGFAANGITFMRKFLFVALLLVWPLSGYMEEAGAGSLHWSNEERVYELRMTRILKSKGQEALLKAMKDEHAQKPRPWTKAWLAYYAIHATEFKVTPPVDQTTAWKWVGEAIQERCVFAHTILGAGLLDGIVPGRQKDLAEGARLVLLAAEAGHPTSMITAAHCYFFGLGVWQDRNQAIEWARRAAYANATMSLSTLAGYYAGGVYVAPADKTRAAQLYYEVALHQNFRVSQPLLALAKEEVQAAEKYQRMLTLEFLLQGARYTNPQVKEAVQWLEQHNADDPEVLTVLSAARLNKQYHIYDPKKAATDLRRAVAMGWADASYYLAYQQLHGIGVPTDEGGALTAIRELAEKGNAKALAQLGWAYYWGPYKYLGVDKNPALALRYSRAAADRGDWFGLLNTGFCYKHGIGTEVSNELAYWYFGLAAGCGSVEGQKEALRLQPYLSN
jgi:TPR repeat protein